MNKKIIPAATYKRIAKLVIAKQQCGPKADRQDERVVCERAEKIFAREITLVYRDPRTDDPCYCDQFTITMKKVRKVKKTSS